MFRSFFLALVALFSAAVPAVAADKSLVEQQLDSIVTSHKIIAFGDGDKVDDDSIARRISRFYIDQFRNFQDPLAPYFLFMSKDATLAMGIGGCVRMRGWYDWGGAIPASAFAPYLIPMTPDPLRQRAFGTTPSGTALFFRVIGQNKHLGEYQLYIEANFNGYAARDFLLKKAYAVVNDWTIGYAGSTFSDPVALPPTVDAQGPNSKMSPSSVLVRWMHDFRHGITFAVSAETPSTRIGDDHVNTAKVESYIPDFAAFGQWQWGFKSHVRLAAIMRSLPYRDLLTSKNHNVIGWGVQLSTIATIGRNITLYGAFNGGRGYASLGGDWLMGNYDLVPDEAVPGRLYPPLAYGGYGAVQYNFTPSLFASTTFGGARYKPRTSSNPDEYKRGLYWALNIFWNPSPRIQVGAELNLGWRYDVNDNHRRAQRVGAMDQFSF